jgi:hypothetical protein
LEEITDTQAMTKKKEKQQSPKQQPEPGQSEPELVVAKVPVKISIGHGETIIDEYEDVIDLEMTETTPEGSHNIAMFFSLTREKGLSTESALFTIASEAVQKEAIHIISAYTSPTHHELHLHVKRNGDITYGKYV